MPQPDMHVRLGWLPSPMCRTAADPFRSQGTWLAHLVASTGQDVAVESGFGSVRTSDGRTVAFLDGGDRGGYPVLGLHGTPCCRLSRWPVNSLYAGAGVRYITLIALGMGVRLATGPRRYR